MQNKMSTPSLGKCVQPWLCRLLRLNIYTSAIMTQCNLTNSILLDR